jgi:D-proline reductase (dithiol) PrdB
MEPVRYVERLNARYRAQGFPPYEWTVNHEAPFAPLAVPLAQARVTLLTSGGVSETSCAAWNPDARNDFRLDAIAANALEAAGAIDGTAFQVHDSYYDTADACQDINCVFPLQRLAELAAEGAIGSVAPRLWSGFMGRIYRRTFLQEEAAPAFAAELAADEVDLALLVPV